MMMSTDWNVAKAEDRLEAVNLLQEYVRNGTLSALSDGAKAQLLAIAKQEQQEAEVWLIASQTDAAVAHGSPSDGRGEQHEQQQKKQQSKDE